MFRTTETAGPWVAIAAVAIALALVGCEREERGFRVDPPSATSVQALHLSDLQPGTPTTQPAVDNPYERNAYALSEGKRLFQQYNCVGCHANGGGGMGPPLIDATWIYGSNPEQIFATIVQGRPNGMPSFQGKVPDYQVWQLAAYVRSLGGLTSKTAATSRDDHMRSKPAENSLDPQHPIQVNSPR
jgi:cytochrome c oxidase cbb3-type subunit 3